MEEEEEGVQVPPKTSRGLGLGEICNGLERAGTELQNPPSPERFIPVPREVILLDFGEHRHSSPERFGPCVPSIARDGEHSRPSSCCAHGSAELPSLRIPQCPNPAPPASGVFLSSPKPAEQARGTALAPA